jgi:nucleotide-binding universal stress UspA family protein
LKHILAALDFTAHADREFHRAVQLAVQHGAELTLAHVLDPALLTNTDETAPSMRAQAIAEADRKLREYTAPPGLKVNFRVAIGDAAREVAMLVREAGADLAILGAHKEKPIQNIFFEATAYYTIQQCEAPFLIVREQAQGPYRRVLALTDFSPCAKRAFHAAVTMAPTAEFHVLHVYETTLPELILCSEDELKEFQQERLLRIEADLTEEMRNFVAQGPDIYLPTATPLLEHSNVDTGVRSAIERLQPDLLVMGLSGRGLAFLVGSRTIAYLNAPMCDMLVTI